MTVTQQQIHKLQTKRINRLLSYIRSHGFNCQYYQNVILVEGIWSSEDGTHTEIESIEPNLQAVRNWLGY